MREDLVNLGEIDIL